MRHPNRHPDRVLLVAVARAERGVHRAAPGRHRAPELPMLGEDTGRLELPAPVATLPLLRPVSVPA